MVQIVCPFNIDYSTGVIVLGNTMDDTVANVDYIMDMYSYNLTPSAISNAYNYMNDPETLVPIFKVFNQYEPKVEDGMYYDFLQSILVFNPNGPKSYFDGSNTLPTNNTFGRMIIQMIAACLFGHPGAQAMIRNEKVVMSSLTSRNSIAKPFINTVRGTNQLDGDAIPNTVLQSLFEQLFAAAPERFNQSDYELQKLPMRQGDILVIDITAIVTISPNTPQTFADPSFVAYPINVNAMFNGRIGYDRDKGRLEPRKIRVKMHLNRDILLSNDTSISTMVNNSKLPQSDTSEKAWMYQKLSNDVSPNISWTVFKNNTMTNYRVSQLESFYVIVRISSGTRVPWISVKTITLNDGEDYSISYRSLWNFKGYYNNGYGSQITKDEKVIFYIGTSNPSSKFFNLMTTTLPSYNLQAFNTGSVMGDQGPQNTNEFIKEIILNSDPESSQGDYLMWVYEIGYKFTNQEPMIVSFN